MALTRKFKVDPKLVGRTVVFVETKDGFYGATVDTDAETDVTAEGDKMSAVAVTTEAGTYCSYWNAIGHVTKEDYGLVTFDGDGYGSVAYPSLLARSSVGATVTVVDDHGFHLGTPTGTDRGARVRSCVGVRHVSSEPGWTFEGWRVTFGNAADASDPDKYERLLSTGGAQSGLSTSFPPGYGAAVVVKLGSSASCSVVFEARYLRADSVGVPVAFDGGGAGVPSRPSATYVAGLAYGELPGFVVASAGHRFDGWHTAETGGSRVSADTPAMPDVTTLYARCSPAASRRVVYDANGGIGAPPCTAFDAAGTVTLPPDRPTWINSSRTFAGWSTERTATAAEHQPGGSIQVDVFEDVTLYAVWKDAYEWVTVTASAGGGLFPSAGGGTAELTFRRRPGIDRYGTDLAGLAPVREGHLYTVLTDPDGRPVYADGPVVRTADHTVTAQWTTIGDSRQLVYVGRSGYRWITPIVGLVTRGCTESGVDPALTGLPPNLGLAPLDRVRIVDARDMYGDAIADLAVGCVSNPYELHNNVAIVDGATVTLACPNDDFTHTVCTTSKGMALRSAITVLMTGGAGGEPYGWLYFRKFPWSDLGVEHLGEWICNMRGVFRPGAKITLAGDELYVEGGDSISILLVPLLSDPASVLVLFDACGGDAENPFRRVLATQPYGALPVPTRDGWTFAGWFTAADGGTPVTAETIVTATAQHVLYAHWTESPGGIYKLYLDPAGGTVEPSALSVVYGQTIGALPTPTRDGHDFAGWFTLPSGGDPVTADTPAGNSDAVIYAHWQGGEIEPPGGGSAPLYRISYKIRLETGGGTVAAEYGPLRYTVGVGRVLPTANEISSPGLTFGGWYASPDLAGEPVAAIGADETGPKKFYAKWN